MIDLHTHSTYSDGVLTPAELVGAARAAKLKALALTDHDTLEGMPFFMEAGRAEGLRTIPGVEVSADWPAGTMHILGYFIGYDDGPLNDALARLREARAERNARILEKLARLGFPLDPDTFRVIAGEGVAGRPHIAQAMIQAGYVADRKAAFDRYLARGRPAYAHRFRLAPAEAFRLIRGAGGVPVLAHPASLKLSNRKLREQVLAWRGAGLGGIEAYHSEHPDSRQCAYLQLANDLGLAVAGGSDYHGTGPIKLGRGFGRLRVPDTLADKLERLAAAG